jgi:hypothetical protein
MQYETERMRSAKVRKVRKGSDQTRSKTAKAATMQRKAARRSKQHRSN